MLRIVADDKIPFLKGVLEPYADVTYVPGNMISRDITLKADALLIRTRTKCNDALLNMTPVRFIATATIGYDHIDTKWCERNNIFWTSAPGCNSLSVQQYIAASLLELSEKEGTELRGKTIGVVGVGNVGSKIARIADSFGMRLLLNDPPRARAEGNFGFVTLETILAESDIVSLHVPLTREGRDATWHFFDDNCFDRMNRRAWFINTSRGEVVDTSSFRKAISRGKISRAVVDVWENEPSIDPDLMAAAFIATPHIAGYSTDGKANGTSMAVNSLCEFFNLPLKKWYPESLPEPDSPVISIDCRGKNDEEILKQAVCHTYDIRSDDRALRNNPGKFEQLRGNYQVRREFPAFKIKLTNCTEEAATLFRKIGFKTTSSQYPGE